MSDNSWDLGGVDPEARERAEEEAARLGVSVADYLTDLMVRRAVLDELAAAQEAEQSRLEPERGAIFAPAPESPEGFAVRQRLKTLERRLGTAVGSLDGAVHALDSSLFDITARVGDVEALAGDTAHALGQTQQEVNNTVAGLQIHLAVVEDNLGALAQTHDERAAGLDWRLAGVERSAAELAGAHEALKYAVAEDFSEFTQETAARLNASLAELRAAADAAAEQADAAVAHLVNELRGLRSSVEERLEESAEATRARMHAAFADAADRMAALAERVGENERSAARAAEQLRTQLTDLEDGAQIALEETAHALREADASLAANLGRATQEQYAALQATRSDLGAQIEAARSELAAGLEAVREDQVTQSARLKLVDVAIGNTINSVSELREAVERRIEAAETGVDSALSRTSASLERRIETVASQLADSAQHQENLQQRLGAELDRVEAASFAALEKLRRDIGAGDADVLARIEPLLEGLRGDLADVRTRAVNEVHLLREEHAGALARLTLLDTALTRLEGSTISTNARLEELESARDALASEVERRIALLEQAAAGAETEQALAVVRAELEGLAARVEAMDADSTLIDRLNALQQGLDGRDGQLEDLNTGLQDVARTLNRVAEQTVETARNAEERVHQVEVALADMRLEVLAHAEQSNTASAIQNLHERVTAFELRQGNALETLRADIARFVADNDRRLEALESKSAADVDGDLAAEFESLRTRIEERVLGVELRSVRTLEQVVDTVALLEQRLLSGKGEDSAAKSA